MRIPIPVRSVPELAFRAWLTPPPLPPVLAARDRDEVADLTPVYFGGIAGYEFGRSGPVALAVHGWGGRPAQMAPIARRLGDEGHHVFVPRLPGHAGGPRTDIKKAAAALGAVVEEVGDPHVIIGHSFAAMVFRLAFAERAPSRVALVAPALNVDDALDVFSDRLRLLPWARRGLRSRLRSWDPDLWPTMSGIGPAQLPGAHVLIVHDPNDRETPFLRSAELAAIRASTAIVPIVDAGHSRILSNQAALDHLARFVSRADMGTESAA